MYTKFVHYVEQGGVDRLWSERNRYGEEVRDIWIRSMSVEKREDESSVSAGWKLPGLGGSTPSSPEQRSNPSRKKKSKIGLGQFLDNY